MDDIASRWRVAAEGFGRRVDGVPDGSWEQEAPCDGWVARDVVRHQVDWVPPFLADGAGVDLGTGPDVDEDPAGAWHHLDRAVRALLDDPAVHERRFEHPRAGSHALDDAVAQFVLGDVLVHTWDLARATGQDEALAQALVGPMLVGLEPVAPMLAASGQYGPVVEMGEGADEQSRLLALTGRRP